MQAHKHRVNVAFRLDEAKHRELRLALARKGWSLQQVMERSVDDIIARSWYGGDNAPPPEDLMGLLAETDVMRMRRQSRREELRRERKRL